MRTSENIQDISKAIVAAQKEIEPAKKNALNPFYKTYYADMGEVIDAIKGPLNKNGIAFLQLCDVDGTGADIVTTMLIHETGQFIAADIKVHSVKQDPQEYGKAITYAKRYSLQAVLGLATEDDDGNSASGKSDAKAKPQQQKKAPEPPAPQTPPAKSVMDKAWDQYRATFTGPLPAGCEWDASLFQEAVKKVFGKLPTNESSIAKIIAANIPHAECWRSNNKAA